MSNDWPLRTSTLRDRTATAVADPVLRANVGAATDRFRDKRTSALARIHDPDALRSAARGVRSEILSSWAETLELLADNVQANGGHVCWATAAM
jgi:L-lactate dehydrogenase complex protein LldF